MKKVVIYPKAAFGFRGMSGIGLDRAFPSFKRKSVKLKEKLLQELSAVCEIEVSDGFLSPTELIEKKEATVVLISPYVKELFKDIDRHSPEYYFLSEKEFDSEGLEKLIAYLQKKKYKNKKLAASTKSGNSQLFILSIIMLIFQQSFQSSLLLNS